MNTGEAQELVAFKLWKAGAFYTPMVLGECGREEVVTRNGAMGQREIGKRERRDGIKEGNEGGEREGRCERKSSGKSVCLRLPIRTLIMMSMGPLLL